MTTATLVGIDLGKHSFHLHGQDADGREVFCKKATRQQMMRWLGNVCTVVMEAGASAHYLARQLATMGHEAKLISPTVRTSLRQGQQERLHRCQGDL